MNRSLPETTVRHGGLSFIRRSDAFLSVAQAEYALRQLWRLCGGSYSDGVRSGIEFCSASREDVLQLHSSNAAKTDWVSLVDFLPPGASLPLDTGQLPGLLSTREPDARGFRGNGDFPLDLVTLTFLGLSRWEETVEGQRDSHDRFPAERSLAHRLGFLDRPIVDEWALVLRSWLRALRPDWEPHADRYQVRLTCDLDHPLRYPNIKRTLLSVGSSVLRGSPKETVSRIANAAKRFCKWKLDPNYRDLIWLSDLAEELGLPLFVNVMTAGRGPFDEGYVADHPPNDQIIAQLSERNVKLGFHPGYNTCDDDKEFARQKLALDRRVGTGVEGGRQHYLRFRVPNTWRQWNKAGFGYDSSLGFPESTGFRCGTSHPFPVFDCLADEELRLIEFPLVVMDRTIDSYLAYTHGQAVDEVARLAQRCRAVSGVFTVLIHNSVGDDWKRTYSAALRKVRPDPQ